jgi:hypothetical protein
MFATECWVYSQQCSSYYFLSWWVLDITQSFLSLLYWKKWSFNAYITNPVLYHCYILNKYVCRANSLHNYK